MNMTLIYAGKKHRHSVVINLKWVLLLLIVLSTALGLGGWRAYLHYADTLMQSKIDNMSRVYTQQDKEVEQIRQLTDQRLIVMATKVGELQAQLSRLNALGQRIAEQSDLGDEFDFSQAPPIGGPGGPAPIESVELQNLLTDMDGLTSELKSRQEQLQLLETVLLNRHIEEISYIAGRPVKGKNSWLTSPFGARTDPFTGKITMHRGVDIAGKNGMEIVATAAGVVSWAGHKTGYGKLVEIDHGNGFITRYAHAKEVNVKDGELVSKGQTIALMGTTGRSTGPHVHYEVLKNGRHLNPKKYVYR